MAFLRPLQLHVAYSSGWVAVNYIELCSLIEEHGCLNGIPREPCSAVGTGSGLLQRARRAMGLLAPGNDSRCGSAAAGIRTKEKKNHES
jgi:hypothetical protein